MPERHSRKKLLKKNTSSLCYQTKWLIRFLPVTFSGPHSDHRLRHDHEGTPVGILAYYQKEHEPCNDQRIGFRVEREVCSQF